MSSLRLASGILAVLGFLLVHPALSHAQTATQPSPAAEFSKARRLYYTPVDKGLQGFQCEVSFDWKSFLEKSTNQPVPDTDDRLRYLRSIHLSVDDDLSTRGQLHWEAPTTAPDQSEDSITRIRSGMQQMWSGFFQGWNAFYNGGMVSVTDSQTTVERSPGGGFHVFVRQNGSLVEEQYDGNLILQSLHVSTPELDSNMRPTFAPSPQGLLVTGMNSVYKQPPTAEGAQVDMKVQYAPVSGFQLPSELVIEVPGTTSFDFHLNNCTVKTQLTQK